MTLMCVTYACFLCVCVCVCAVELPPDDDGMEACSGTLVWEHCDPQTSRADPSHCTIHRFSCQRGNTHTHTLRAGLIEPRKDRGRLNSILKNTLKYG